MAIQRNQDNILTLKLRSNISPDLDKNANWVLTGIIQINSMHPKQVPIAEKRLTKI